MSTGHGRCRYLARLNRNLMCVSGYVRTSVEAVDASVSGAKGHLELGKGRRFTWKRWKIFPAEALAQATVRSPAWRRSS